MEPAIELPLYTGDALECPVQLLVPHQHHERRVSPWSRRVIGAWWFLTCRIERRVEVLFRRSHVVSGGVNVDLEGGGEEEDKERNRPRSRQLDASYGPD